MTARVWGARLAAILWVSAAVADELPLEAYGKLPTISMMALSATGTRIAYRRTEDESDVIAVQDLRDGSFLASLDVSTTNPRGIQFIGDEYVILLASEPVRFFNLRRQHDIRGAYVFDVMGGEARLLLARSRLLRRDGPRPGRILGHSKDHRRLYTAGYLNALFTNARPDYGILEVDLASNSGSITTRGTADTVDWFVDENGAPLVGVVEEYGKDVNRVYKVEGADSQLLYESSPERPSIPIGLTPDRKALVSTAVDEVAAVTSYFATDLENGTVRPQIFEFDDVEIQRPIMGIDRLVHGVEYGGFLPSYSFLDPELDRRVAEIQASLDGTAAALTSWTQDFGKLLFELSGGWNSGAYVLISRGSAESRLIAHQRPDIPAGFVVPTTITEYAARDGMKIPALLTMKPEVRERGNASLIVLPHGGPAVHDQLRFDWLAQFFASRGHAVLQPQFRGSSGFSHTLRRAGRGEWGGKMSTDLDDGVQALVDARLVDPRRVCMVGISYGGYAALAAGAFSPFGYRCVASVNGVSDLREMLREVRGRYGRNHPAVEYWQTQLVSAGTHLEDISPADHAALFRGPVLLLHAKDDAVVPREQSRRMERALKRAKKPVELVLLEGEDHYLSHSKTRIDALRSLDSFIHEHLLVHGADAE